MTAATATVSTQSSTRTQTREVEKKTLAPAGPEVVASPEAVADPVADADRARPTPQTAADARNGVRAHSALQQRQLQARLDPPVENRPTWARTPSLEDVESGRSVMMRGHRGPQRGPNAVRDVQQLLNEGGANPPLERDGIFGPRTESAVRDYQTRNGLQVDGIVGRQTLGSLRNQSGTGPNGEKVTETNPALARLDEGVRGTIEGELARHPNDVSARGTITDVAASPGFAELSTDEQNRLTRTIGGTNRQLSEPSRSAARTLIDSAEFRGADAAGQAAQLRTFLQDQPGAPGVLGAAPGTFDGRRLDYTLGEPTEVAGHPFRGGAADALRYDVQIDGRTIPVYVPKTQDPANGSFHSIDEVARGLAALPASSRNAVNSVTVEPSQNPADGYWATEYGDPNFRSYMTAGADGDIAIYPTLNGTPPQESLDVSLIHETGHTLSDSAWGSDDSDARWDPWKAAVASDGVVASQYARSSPGEDFAETLKLYQLVRGTPQEAEIRALMPERFRVLEALLAGR